MSAPTWRYTLCEPTLGAEEAEAAKAVVESGWLSMGPRTQAFEAAFAELLGADHAVAVSNGTAALHVAMAALDIGPGDEVIQPSLTFVASANMTVALGATPVFADISSLTQPTLDVADVARRITPRTKAVVAMHYGGYPGSILELKALCEERGLILIEDACHGPAQSVGDDDARALGTLGAAGTFSFFANKNMTTGEGGMIVTNDADLAAKLRLIRSHGMTTLSWDRHKGRASTYDVVAHGFNYRTDELRSAIGLVQLGRLKDANAGRRRVACAYAEAFSAAQLPGVHYVHGDAPGAGAGHIAGLVVPKSQRDRLREVYKAAGIQTSLHYPPIHQFTAFAERFGGAGAMDALPVTIEFAERVLTLPIHPGLDIDDAREIAQVAIDALQSELADAA